jgi:hypothetical protein
MRAWGWIARVGIALAAVLAIAPAALAASPFADWAVIVVAGDDHAHSGAPSQAFDNARRDLVKDLVAEGFASANISQFSAKALDTPAPVAPAPKGPAPKDKHPHKAPIAAPSPPAATSNETAPLISDPKSIYLEMQQLTKRATGGCLIYFTSHGGPGAVLVGKSAITPNIMGQMVDAACGQRPTVAIISACFSGIFVEALNGPNRMVLTAARPDRTSFGCGEADRYTYFDGCFLQSLPQSHDFAALGNATRACVSRREIETHAEPPSEPQMEVGAQLRLILPLYAFNAPPGSLVDAGVNAAPAKP